MCIYIIMQTFQKISEMKIISKLKRKKTHIYVYLYTIAYKHALQLQKAHNHFAHIIYKETKYIC